MIFYNALIYIEASILKHIMSVASESKIAAAFINAKFAISQCICLLEIGYPQLAALFEINNIIAHGILMKHLMPKRSKAIHIKFY